MEARANMRALLESARQSIRGRAANASGSATKTNVATIASTSSSSQGHRSAESRASLDVAGRLHFQKDTGSGAEGTTAEGSLSAKDNRMQFVQHYYRLLCAFIEDKSKYELELPNLSALDRMVVHALAEKCNLSHESAGSRADRVMHLKKDILFFQNPEAAQEVNLDEIIDKVSWKESKYQIKYVRSANPAQVAVGDIGSYADEDALQKIERFRRATDEYRHATDMGYTQQELLLAEAKGGGPGEDGGEDNYAVPTNVEEILSRQDPATVPAITADPSASATSAALPSTSSLTAASTAARAMRAAASASTSPSAAKTAKAIMTTVFDEVCRACGSRARLDGPPQGWKCSHYCAHCTRNTIWSLEEVKVEEMKPAATQGTSALKRRWDGVDADGASEKKKRRTRPHGVAAVEEIDHEEDEAEAVAQARHAGADGQVLSDAEENEECADDDLTVEDVMEVAATNDFSAKDMNWLREFASHGSPHLGSRIAFCIDFSDLTDMPIFSRYGTKALGSGEEKGLAETHAVWYVVLREVRELSMSVSDLLRELLSEAFAVSSTTKIATADTPTVEEIQTEDVELRAMEHLAVAFPNLSVYGTECVAVCQLRPVVRAASVQTMSIKPDALRALRKRYGEQHVFASQSLMEAVSHATDSAAA